MLVGLDGQQGGTPGLPPTAVRSRRAVPSGGRSKTAKFSCMGTKKCSCSDWLSGRVDAAPAGVDGPARAAREKWRRIEAWNGAYEASSLGRIREAATKTIMQRSRVPGYPYVALKVG